MRIRRAIAVPAVGGYYFDDQEALRAGAKRDGFLYHDQPRTPGFSAVRQPSEAVSILLILEDGHVAHGDCVANQYAGAGGRDTVLSATTLARHLQKEILPRIEGARVKRFRQMISEWTTPQSLTGMSTPARYGLSQAFLDAASHVQGKTMAETVADEYELDPPSRLIPIFAQSGEDVYANVDKMILRRVACLPHGLISSPDKVGPMGENLRELVAWVVDRVKGLSEPEYRPVYHFDVYGLLGVIFGGNVRRVADYMGSLWNITQPNTLRIEYPMLARCRDEAIDLNQRLREQLRQSGIPVKISVDEWCNSRSHMAEFMAAQAADLFQVKSPVMGCLGESIEAILQCQGSGFGAYLGGSCTETERSAQVCAQVALAVKPDQVLAKPGMGVDEGYQVVYNEMQRALALMRRDQGVQ